MTPGIIRVTSTAHMYSPHIWVSKIHPYINGTGTKSAPIYTGHTYGHIYRNYRYCVPGFK